MGSLIKDDEWPRINGAWPSKKVLLPSALEDAEAVWLGESS